MRPALISIAIALLLVPAVSLANMTRAFSGRCGDTQIAAVEATIVFTPTGGNFGAGTGTATVDITLENTTGVYPFQNPRIGNPVQTAFIFNVPPSASVELVDAKILAGSRVVSTGTTMDGVTIPPGCTALAADQSQPGWYELQSGTSAGQYGVFTNSIETDNGIKAGLVDPDLYPGCVAQGDVFSPLVVAGRVKLTLSLENLDLTLVSCDDFLDHCSKPLGADDPAAFAAKFQGTAADGEESCRVADLGYCVPVPAEERSWGSIKALYR